MGLSIVKFLARKARPQARDMPQTDNSETQDPFFEIKLNRRRLAHFCRGLGVEIGPLHIPTEGLSPGARTLYMDRASTSDLLKYFESNPGVPASSIVPVDVIGDAMSFPYRDASLDFLIANHVLEHLANPLKALSDWHRCLKEGGILYLSLPDKRFCSFCAGPEKWIYPDAARRLTTWDHLLDDFRRDDKGDSEASREHARDVVHYVEGARPDEIEERVDQFLASDPDYHYHTWTFESLLGAIDRCCTDLGLGFRLEAQLGSYETWGEMIVVLRKDSSAQSILPVAYRYPEPNIEQMDTALGELLPGALWEQSFTTSLQGVTWIDVRFGTFNRRNTGLLAFRLYRDGDSGPIAEQQLDVSELKDNGFYRFEFPPANGTEKTFRFTLEAPEAAPGNAVTVWSANSDDGNLQLTLNGSKRGGVALNFRAFATRTLQRANAWLDDPGHPWTARDSANYLSTLTRRGVASEGPQLR